MGILSCLLAAVNGVGLFLTDRSLANTSKSLPAKRRKFYPNPGMAPPAAMSPTAL